MRIHEIRNHAEENGSKWFHSMKFFRSRIYKYTKEGHVDGQAVTFFISSEQYDDNSPRLYTIRYYNWRNNVNTYGKFQEYKTLSAAKTAMNRLN